ncbi:MAG: sporulation protein YtfJ, partial [Clostridia bacterium]|nr:sporulation protein YtfJ [Clostridia bacterium]
MSENKLNDIIQTSLDSIRSMVDSNTVIGSPITTANGTLVIPVSKVFVGFASGGVDYLGKNTQNTSHTVNNFGG